MSEDGSLKYQRWGYPVLGLIVSGFFFYFLSDGLPKDPPATNAVRGFYSLCMTGWGFFNLLTLTTVSIFASIPFLRSMSEDCLEELMALFVAGFVIWGGGCLLFLFTLFEVNPVSFLVLVGIVCFFLFENTIQKISMRVLIYLLYPRSEHVDSREKK